jgi:hypothetical protein
MKIELLSISWIDERGLPIVDTPFLLRAGMGSWPHKVIVGLAATANSESNFGYTSAEQFLAPRQYRAALGLSLRNLRVVEADTRIDPGYTPPPNRTNVWSAPFPQGLVGVVCVKLCNLVRAADVVAPVGNAAALSTGRSGDQPELLLLVLAQVLHVQVAVRL